MGKSWNLVKNVVHGTFENRLRMQVILFHDLQWKYLKGNSKKFGERKGSIKQFYFSFLIKGQLSITDMTLKVLQNLDCLTL